MSSGIYKIANKLNDNFYIGSAIDIKQRFRNHVSQLKHTKHPNIILQRIINKYGFDVLFFEIIEYVENKNNLIIREQYYIDNLNPKYNICKTAGSRLGTKASKETKKKLSESHKGPRLDRRGFKHSNESKAKMSYSHTGKKLSDEHKKKIGSAHKGRKQTKEWIQKRADSRGIIFKLKSPEGIIIKSRNIAKFCEENNLCRSLIHRVLHGERNHHKGWTRA